jgi:hypothetical protein
MELLKLLIEDTANIVFNAEFFFPDSGLKSEQTMFYDTD